MILTDAEIEDLIAIAKTREDGDWRYWPSSRSVVAANDDGVGTFRAHEDGQLACIARNALPSLLAEVKAARAAIKAATRYIPRHHMRTTDKCDCSGCGFWRRIAEYDALAKGTL